MLCKVQPLFDVNWDNLIARVGLASLTTLWNSSQLISMNNWTMLPHMSQIWSKLLDAIDPASAPPSPPRTLFVDLADPEKRTGADLLKAMRLLGRFQKQMNVILGLNLKESTRVADELKLPGNRKTDQAAEAAVEETAAAIRKKLGLSCVVIHPRASAAAATESETACFPGPFVRKPKLSTGAGDLFNAGFCLGRVLGFSLAESLCTGVASSGYYVRTGHSPSVPQLSRFTARLPAPEK